MIGLTIAGLDPSGGAGVLTDIKTFSALGIHGTCVITNLTAQNPDKVYGIKEIDTDFISLQFDSLLNEYPIKYGKTGMLYSKDIVKLVSEKIVENELNIIIDPVMIASSGSNLSDNNYSKYLKTIKVHGIVTVDSIKILSRNSINPIWRISNYISIKIKNDIRKIMDESSANVFQGLILGDTSQIDKQLQENFRISSIAHVLAISGMHISYVIIGINILTKKVI